MQGDRRGVRRTAPPQRSSAPHPQPQQRSTAQIRVFSAHHGLTVASGPAPSSSASSRASTRHGSSGSTSRSACSSSPSAFSRARSTSHGSRSALLLDLRGLRVVDDQGARADVRMRWRRPPPAAGTRVVASLAEGLALARRPSSRGSGGRARLMLGMSFFRWRAFLDRRRAAILLRLRLAVLFFFSIPCSCRYQASATRRWTPACGSCPGPRPSSWWAPPIAGTLADRVKINHLDGDRASDPGATALCWIQP